ncbi:AraC family transcriptional regulator [Nitrospirillum sp. BR 11164]|uniref:helix-turn-helix transcriptional regulator n=1 Tax=Nitrospirillum sp. BR 11164 TaxID=3104324 RepID=UPI002AFDF5D6|nr:AraC family transcriptional regulator [Nitrospirillum sp. BR 11164]MEA1652813.1 AraC family transcriptional regulator [Nitrospirillum sp. BR 11164]
MTAPAAALDAFHTLASLPTGLPPGGLLAGGHLATVARLLEEAMHAVEHDVAQARDRIVKVRDLLLHRSQEGMGRPEEATRGGLAPWQARRVAALVERRLGGTLCNEDLAAEAKLSTSHFCTAFRQTFGMSPHAFIISRRVERAKALMLDTDDALAEIADACGFADQAHLSRLFRQATGSSPASWRRANAVDISLIA